MASSSKTPSSHDEGEQPAKRERRQSGRNQNKMIPNIGVDTSVKPAGTSHNLVVCGATNHEHGFIFSDFMGFCMCLREYGMTGTFLSCFPLEEHFVWLKNERGINEIKFGKIGPNQDALCTYTRHQFTRRDQNWWTQVGKEVIKDEVIRWIEAKIQQAKAGDVVNIILEGHGREAGSGYAIGTLTIYPSALNELLARFADSVHVNVILGSCYSGAFVDAIRMGGQNDRFVASSTSATQVALGATRALSGRHRNSRYSQAFVQAFTQIGLPRSASSPTLSEFEQAVDQNLRRNLTLGKLIDPHQSHFSAPITLKTLVSDMVLRDKFDLLHNPKHSARRQRYEWPAMDERLLNRLRRAQPPAPAPALVNEAKKLIEAEISKCQHADEHLCDHNIYTYWVYRLTGREPPVGDVLKLLYYRARRQSAIWDVYCQLLLRELVTTECLCLPLDQANTTRAVSIIKFFLSCFQGVQKTDDGFNTESAGKLLPDEWFTADMSWLAAMIIRGCSNIDNVLNVIIHCKYLGDFDASKFAEIHQIYPDLVIENNPNELSDRTTQGNCFGFWLPHDISDKKGEYAAAIDDRLARFNRIEKGFKLYFDVPDDELQLDPALESYADSSSGDPSSYYA